MQRTTALLVLATSLVGASPALAANADTQVWVTESATVPLAHAVNGTFEISERFRENGDQLLTRGTADFRLSGVAAVGGGAAYVETFGGADEFRPHQQLTLGFGAVSLRSRVEERFFDGADRMELRLRQRIGVSEAVSSWLKAGLTGELLYIARSRDAGGDAHVDSWRANATLTRRLAPRFEGTLGYLAILAPRDGGPDRLSHVIQLSIGYRR
jgi:hypothetical protein